MLCNISPAILHNVLGFQSWERLEVISPVVIELALDIRFGAKTLKIRSRSHLNWLKVCTCGHKCVHVCIHVYGPTWQWVKALGWCTFCTKHLYIFLFMDLFLHKAPLYYFYSWKKLGCIFAKKSKNLAIFYLQKSKPAMWKLPWKIGAPRCWTRDQRLKH